MTVGDERFLRVIIILIIALTASQLIAGQVQAMIFAGPMGSLAPLDRGISLGNDLFLAPDAPGSSRGSPLLEGPRSSTSPGYFETSEFMMGSVAVGIILVESDGSIDPSTEDWDSSEEQRVHDEIEDALQWWAAVNPDAGLSFHPDYHYRVPVGYEPISRPQSNEGLWIRQAMAHLGYGSGSTFTRVRNYLNDLRIQKGTDWAFVIFVVDSSNDPDGRFSDGYSAYAYLGGPFTVLTYDNGNWGISRMNRVCAHEIGHIFYATDEYDGDLEYSGYLNLPDNDHSGCLMDNNVLTLSTGTEGQIGWRDVDVDGIPDILDTPPQTTLQAFQPDPTQDDILYYSGSASESPYPNSNPYGTGRDLTLNEITTVEFRIDSGGWLPATASDGAFDSLSEGYHFTTPPLPAGTHTIYARASDSAGNIDASPASDTVTVNSYEYEIEVSPPLVSIGQGTNTLFEVLINPTGAPGETVALGLDGWPGEVGTYEFTPGIGTCPFSSLLVLQLNPDSPPGTYLLVVEGNGDHHDARSNTFTLKIVDDIPPVSAVEDLPPSILNESFEVSWTGEDNHGGSGVEFYDVQFREDSGPWTDWVVHTTLTSRTFEGEMGRTYEFRCRAIDEAGNTEAYPQGGDTTVTLGILLVIETSYDNSSAKIEGNWYHADGSGDIRIGLVPGEYELTIESPLFLGDSTIAYFEQWGDGNSSNPRNIDFANSTTISALFYEEYRLEVTSVIGDPSGSGWYHEGANVTFAVAPLVDFGNRSRAVFGGWGGNSTSSLPESWIVMSGGSTVRATWVTEHHLEVTSPCGSPWGSGWYEHGSEGYFLVDGKVDHGNGTRRFFESWSGDFHSELRVGSVTMDKPMRARATWRTEHYLEVLSAYGYPTDSGWHEDGNEVLVSVEPIVDFDNGTRMSFDTWGGAVDSGEYEISLLIDSPKTVEASWTRQHYLEVKSPWGDPQDPDWVESGTARRISINETWNHGNGTRRSFVSWIGDVVSESPSVEIIIDGPTHAQAMWEKQHQLVLDGRYAQAEGGGWYPEGERARVEIAGIFDCGNGTRRIFLGWGGGELGSDGRIEMVAPIQLISVWSTEHHLRVISEHADPYGEGWYAEDQEAEFGVGGHNVTEGGLMQVFLNWTGGMSPHSTINTVPMDGPKEIEARWETWYLLDLETSFSESTGQGWYPAGSMASVGVDTPLYLGNGTRLVCDGWIGNPIELEPRGTVLMSAPRHLEASWSREYFLDLVSPHGVAGGGGWIEANENASISIDPVVDYLNGTRYVLHEWKGDTKLEEPEATVRMNRPLDLVASWTREDLISMVFTDREGRSLEPEEVHLSSSSGEMKSNSNGTWFSSGTWRVESVIWRGSEVAPPELSFEAGNPGVWTIECLVQDLRISLVDYLGIPVTGAMVEIRLPDRGSVTGTTDENGKCTLTMIPAGKHEVEIHSLGLNFKCDCQVDGTGSKADMETPFSLTTIIGSLLLVVCGLGAIVKIAR